MIRFGRMIEKTQRSCGFFGGKGRLVETPSRPNFALYDIDVTVFTFSDFMQVVNIAKEADFPPILYVEAIESIVSGTGVSCTNLKYPNS